MMTPAPDSSCPADACGNPAEAARRRVAIPSVGLIVLSVMILVAAVVGAVVLSWGLIFAFDGREREAGFVNTGLCVAMIPYAALMLAGAGRMRQLREYRLAMTAAIMAFPFIPVIVGIGGVWAFIVLLRRDVRGQFPRPGAGAEAVPDPSRRDAAGDACGDYDEYSGDPAAVAQARIWLPATLLLGAAAISLLLALALTAWGIGLMFFDVPHPEAGTQEGFEMGALIAGMGFAGTVLMPVIMIGAAPMRQCRRYRLAKTAAIIGVLSVFPLLYLSALVLPCAVWSLLVMRSPAVKEQFRLFQPSVSGHDA